MATAQTALDEIRLAMAATNEIFNQEVFGKRNFSALNEIYTTNAYILPPGGPMVSGLPGITEFWSNLVQSANATGGGAEVNRGDANGRWGR